MRSNNKVVLNYVHKNNLLCFGWWFAQASITCPLADTIFKVTLWSTLLSFSKAWWYIFAQFYLEIVTLVNQHFPCKQFFIYFILQCQRQQSLYIFMLILKIQMFSFQLTSQCNALIVCEAMRQNSKLACLWDSCLPCHFLAVTTFFSLHFSSSENGSFSWGLVSSGTCLAQGKRSGDIRSCKWAIVADGTLIALLFTAVCVPSCDSN